MTHPSTVADTLDAGHTPGPWTAYEYAGGWWVSNLTDDSGPMVCVGSWPDDREANARLIAAAPDLLEALDSGTLNILLGMIEDSGDAEMWEKARWFMGQRDTAIAKARGEVQP